MEATGFTYCTCNNGHCEGIVPFNDAGFEATEVTVQACDNLRREGIVSYTVRKSELLRRGIATRAEYDRYMASKESDPWDTSESEWVNSRL